MKRATAAAALAAAVARGPRTAATPQPRSSQEPPALREGVRTLSLIERQRRLEALQAMLGPVPANREQRRAREKRLRKLGVVKPK